jgi:hypothetical protein
MRRSAEKAFLELGLRDMARIDGWVMVDASQMAANLMMDTVERASEFAFLDPGKEDPMPGLNPLEQERPWMLQGQIPEVRAALHVHNAGEIVVAELRARMCSVTACSNTAPASELSFPLSV